MFDGYDDWYLPSKDELQLLFSLNLVEVTEENLQNYGWYISSSENSNTMCYGVWIDNWWTDYSAGKDVQYTVRPIRSF